jgi:hypothetical protein
MTPERAAELHHPDEADPDPRQHDYAGNRLPHRDGDNRADDRHEQSQRQEAQEPLVSSHTERLG